MRPDLVPYDRTGPASIVHLGVDLGGVATKATLADAFVLAMSRVGATVTRTAARA